MLKPSETRFSTISLKIVCARELLAFIAVAATVFMVLPYLPLQAARRTVENIIIARGFVAYGLSFPEHDHKIKKKGLA